MLTIAEYKKLENLITGMNKPTAQDVLDFIKENLVKDNPMENLRGNDHIHVIQKNKPVVASEQRKREIEGGFKVRTQGEGELADSLRNKNIPANAATPKKKGKK